MNRSAAPGNAPGRFLFWGGGGSHRGAQPGRGPVLPHPTEAEPGPPHAVPRLVRPASCNGPGRTGERAALPHWAEAEPGFPHVVRIRTDIFLRRGKCPRCRVRWGETGRSTFRQTNLLLARAARGPGSFARGGRVPVRRRTRRFGHAALPPCSVFAPRRTTRRQCRGLFSFHRAAGRAKQGSALPCFCFARLAAPLPPRRRCAKINRIYPKMRLCRRRRFSWPRPS